MLYISGLYALNLPCKLKLQGDCHMSSLDWNKVEYLESNDSLYEDYGIEVGYSNVELGLQNVNKANYIRACLDLLEHGKYSVLKNSVIVILSPSHSFLMVAIPGFLLWL